MDVSTSIHYDMRFLYFLNRLYNHRSRQKITKIQLSWFDEEKKLLKYVDYTPLDADRWFRWMSTKQGRKSFKNLKNDIKVIVDDIERYFYNADDINVYGTSDKVILIFPASSFRLKFKEISDDILNVTKKCLSGMLDKDTMLIVLNKVRKGIEMDILERLERKKDIFYSDSNVKF